MTGHIVPVSSSGLMPRPLRWSQLLPGALIVAGFAIAAVAVLTFGRVGALHGPTTPLHVLVGSANGVLKGTEVWLDGQKIGLVDAIRFRPISSDTSERLLLDIDVYTSALPRLRRDSDARIRPGGTLIGTPVIDLASGTSRAAPLVAGDTIRAIPVVDGRSIAASAADATRELPAIMADARRMLAGLQQDGHGSIGPLARDGTDRLDALARAFSRTATSGDGTIGRFARDTAIRARLSRVSAGLDSIRSGMADSARTDYGRFRRDSTLMHSLEAMRAELGDVRASLARSRGARGRREGVEPALARELDHTRAAIDSLIDDVRRHPLRYLRF
jgi:hypothetical protein